MWIGKGRPFGFASGASGVQGAEGCPVSGTVKQNFRTIRVKHFCPLNFGFEQPEEP